MKKQGYNVDAEVLKLMVNCGVLMNTFYAKVFVETCYDLPKYASCGLLQFRFPQFREITYNLLTDNQKKEFHHRAIRYLEKETRKCKACGGGFFERILGGDRIDKVTKSNFVDYVFLCIVLLGHGPNKEKSETR